MMCSNILKNLLDGKIHHHLSLKRHFILRRNVRKTSDKLRIIYYDLETTGLNFPTHQGVQICSIAAISHGDSYSTFNHCFIPTCEIHPKASKINGFKVSGDCLYKNNELVKDALPIKGTWLMSSLQKLI